METQTEYIYLDDEYKNVMYTSINKPLKYEDQTPCIKIHGSKEDMDILMNLLGMD